MVGASDRDPGDEHVDAPPAPRDELLELLGSWDDIQVVAYDVFEFMTYAESMRDCCRACAEEANGEDGS